MSRALTKSLRELIAAILGGLGAILVSCWLKELGAKADHTALGLLAAGTAGAFATRGVARQLCTGVAAVGASELVTTWLGGLAERAQSTHAALSALGSRA